VAVVVTVKVAIVTLQGGMNYGPGGLSAGRQGSTAAKEQEPDELIPAAKLGFCRKKANSGEEPDRWRPEIK
jgi:hypothetical protein